MQILIIHNSHHNKSCFEQKYLNFPEPDEAHNFFHLKEEGNNLRFQYIQLSKQHTQYIFHSTNKIKKLHLFFCRLPRGLPFFQISAPHEFGSNRTVTAC